MRHPITMSPPRDPRSRKHLGQLAGLSIGKQHLPCLKSPDGAELPIPHELFVVLIQVAKDLCQGKSVVVTCGDQSMTPRTAAEHLGMSRQFLVQLLDQGALPFHRVGSHRRLLFQDVQAFAEQRAERRRKALEKLRDDIEAAGLDT